MKIYKMAILGCGDFLRLQSDDIKSSQYVAVKSLFDLDRNRAEKYAGMLGGSVVDTAGAIFNDNEIDIVCIFVPPWARKDLITKAAKSGKHIITTKPLGSNVSDCANMVNATEGKVKCGVFYLRTGNAVVETYKKIFKGGEIGNLALYKQDWIHHYPEWNRWATDPQKNGGPFMDAMVHNLNAVRYLMGRKETYCTYFSDNHAHNLKCNDTEFMKLDFEGRGSAHLFITWAADLAVYSKEGNDREHIGIFYMITDQGWHLTQNIENGKMMITASKEGKTKKWNVEKLLSSPYDSFAEAVENDTHLPSDIPDIREAYEDIKILKDAEKNQGQKIVVNLSV